MVQQSFCRWGDSSWIQMKWLRLSDKVLKLMLFILLISTADTTHMQNPWTWQTGVLPCKQLSEKTSFPSDGYHRSKVEFLLFTKMVPFSVHASPLLPVGGFWEFLHFLNLFYFIFIFLIITKLLGNIYSRSIR